MIKARADSVNVDDFAMMAEAYMYALLFDAFKGSKALATGNQPTKPQMQALKIIQHGAAGNCSDKMMLLCASVLHVQEQKLWQAAAARLEACVKADKLPQPIHDFPSGQRAPLVPHSQTQRKSA